MQVMEKGKNCGAEALQYFDGLNRTALLMLDDTGQVPDAIRETFVAAHLTWDTLWPMPSYRVWLFKILNSIIVDDHPLAFMKSSADDSEIDDNDYYNNPANHFPIEILRRIFFSRVSSESVRDILLDIPDHIRLVFILSILEGFSYGEIADIAGIDLETVRSRLRLGRLLIQRELFDQVASEAKYDMPVGRVRRSRTG
jgi:RNA polymerase sigma-70 factor (ECF subfamily)